MKPAQINLDGDREIYQGDDYLVTLVFFQADGVTPQDLTTYTAQKAQIRLTAQSTTQIADFTCAKLNQTTNPGQVTIALLSATTTGLAGSTGTTTAVWDFEQVDPAGKKGTWFAGNVTVVPEVTRG